MGRVARRIIGSPPFLREIRANWTDADSSGGYPFNIPLLASRSLTLRFTSNVTIFVGENGSGKSTLLEAIAANCGFSLDGGNRNHSHGEIGAENLSRYLTFSWLPRIGHGFFLRAETLHQFMDSIDDLAAESGDGIYEGYGGRSLRARSHGEAFTAIFESRFQRPGIYILDEPEAALSPIRQIEFLKLLARLDAQGQSQFIIATHSPIVMSHRGASLLEITRRGILETQFKHTEHFKILQKFYSDPEAFLDHVLAGSTDPDG